MQKIRITDTTLRSREENGESSYSFREKIEIAKTLDRIGVDVIEMPPFTASRADVLLLHTVLPVVKNAAVSCRPALDEGSVAAACEAMKGYRNARIHISVPTSPVQMEYHCHKKPKPLMEMTEKLITAAVGAGFAVEFSAADATRAEREFLYEILTLAVKAGVKYITLCDSEGIMLPDEFAAFVTDVKANVALGECELGVECSDFLHMGCALAIAAIGAGASTVKTAVGALGATPLSAFASVLKMRGDSLGITSSLNAASLGKTAAKIIAMASPAGADKTVSGEGDTSGMILRNTDDERTVAAAVSALGYDLSEEDMHKVYESFKRLAEKKTISGAELDVIVASCALEVAPTFILKSYSVTSSNVISASAHIEMEKDGTLLRGISLGDGPVDAAFRAIEQIVGHRFELDDFGIRALTEGQEAVSETVVRLRAGGKIYSGRGVSTDIIGSSIRAYVSALNKICFEETL